MTTTAQRVPAVGERAPAFALKSTSGQTVSLEQFAGKQHVLLAFFPAAFTSVCTAEMCAFTDDYDQFASSSVAVLPVSVDNVPALKAFKAQENLAVELLSDFQRSTARDYGVLLDGGVANRAYFLIDRDGIVRWAHVEEHPGKSRTNAEILEQIAKLG